MKFLMFADLHYHPGVFYGDDLDALKLFQKRAVEEGCEFILHAGDLCHGPSHVPELIEACNASPVPMYHCLGNHDTDRTSFAETLKLYNMPRGYYHFDCAGYRFMILDPNHCCVDGEYIHYDMGNYFQWPGNRDYTPPEQLEWIRNTIDESPYPCILVSHDSYEREFNSSRDYKEVQQIIRQANEKSPHKVLMVINGHHHRDFIRILDNVLHWDVNAVWYDWVGEEPHNGYPKEMCEKWSCLSKTIVYTQPLYAIVTLEGTTITIEGTESEMLFGVTRETIGAPLLDGSGRSVVPKIQSCKVTLH